MKQQALFLCWSNDIRSEENAREQRGDEAYEASAVKLSEASDRLEQQSEEDM